MLARAAKRIESGNFEAVVAVKGRDELATLTRAFNKMAASIRNLIENDQRMLRREREIRTQLEATTAALARSNRDLEQFVYIASHDLKAPLRAIVQLADWLEEDLAPSMQGEGLANLQLMRGRAMRLQGLLDGLGEYARASQPGATPQQVDTGAVIAQALERLEPPPAVVVEAQDALPMVWAPPGVLDRVFGELIHNAIKHRERDSGCIRIAAEDLGEVYRFEVEDDGPGIPARFHQRIFRIFQTLRPRDEVEGSGIGLAIVWRLLEVHGGEISVASPPGRKGTTFRFTWPKRVSYQQVA
jgi:signal transduction histidine kinase